MSEPVLRPVAAIVEKAAANKMKRNPIPPPPKIAWLALEQLVIDETYQRGLSEASMRLIRRLVQTWDWNCFKPLSVAATGGGLYKVIDGQHTAIAAATHGAIETLPCLVLDAATVAEQARAFVGINRDRVSLTAYALYRSRLAGEDPEAMAVHEGLQAAGGRLLETVRYYEDYSPGDVACVATLLQIVRRGGKNRLARLMRMIVAAEISPAPSFILKGLEEVVTSPEPPADEQLVRVLKQRGDEEILDMARDRRRQGHAPDMNSAVAQVLLHECERAA